MWRGDRGFRNYILATVEDGSIDVYTSKGRLVAKNLISQTLFPRDNLLINDSGGGEWGKLNDKAKNWGGKGSKCGFFDRLEASTLDEAIQSKNRPVQSYNLKEENDIIVTLGTTKIKLHWEE